MSLQSLVYIFFWWSYKRNKPLKGVIMPKFLVNDLSSWFVILVKTPTTRWLYLSVSVSKIKYRNALNLGEYSSSDFRLQLHLACCLQFQAYVLLKESSSVPTTNSEMWLWGKLVWEWHQNLYSFGTVLWTATVTKLQCSWAQARTAAWQLHNWLPLQPLLYLGTAGAHVSMCASVSGPGTERHWSSRQQTLITAGLK